MTQTSIGTDEHVPLLWWSASQLAELERRMEAPVDEWFRQWSARGSCAISISCALAWEDVEGVRGAWAQLGACAEAKAWYVAGPLESLAVGWLFQSEPSARAVAAPPMLASALAREAVQELLKKLREVLQLEATVADTPPAAQLARVWSGAVRFRIGLHDGERPLDVLLNGDAVAALLRPSAGQPGTSRSSRAALTPVHGACANHSVQLEVRLAPCELELAALRNLQPGDIVPLPHPLDLPLRVLLQGETVCQGFLGRRRDAMAIELVRGAGPATNT